MTGMTCPACGVAVTPGYVRCPKCRKPLPRRAAGKVAQGGTAVVESRSPWKAIGIALIALLVIGGIWQGRKAFEDYRSATRHARDAGGDAQVAQVTEQAAPASQIVMPAPSPNTVPTGPNPNVVAAELHHTLERAHLWSTVEIVGDHVDVRSSSCGDPAIRPVLDGAASSFKAAGLTRLRCLEQSGTVVFQRDL